MKHKISGVGTALLLVAGTAVGADTVGADSLNLSDNTGIHYAQPSNPSDLYRSSELSFDAFGTAALGEHSIEHLSDHRIRHDTRLGLGIGLNYFFCQYVGIGAEAYTENTSRNFVDDVSGSLIFRYPIGQTGLAPYGFAGAGYKFDPIDGKFAHLGAGLEFRFTPHIGIFVDARYVFVERESDYGLGRLGFRFAF